MKNRIAAIADRVFLAAVRNAKFELNEDNIILDKQGVFAELDGTLDYDSIDTAFNKEKENLKSIAERLSKELIEQKDIESLQQYNIDVESINPKQYKIVHDDKTNEFFLFLPAYELNNQNSKEQFDNEKEEDDNRNGDMVNEIVNALRKFVKDTDSDEINLLPDDHNSNREKKDTFKKDRYEAEFRLIKEDNKRKDAIESALFLKIKYNGKTVYNKVIRNTFKGKDYGAVKTNNINDISNDISNDDLHTLLKDMAEWDSHAVDAFKQDLFTNKVKHNDKERYPEA